MMIDDEELRNLYGNASQEHLQKLKEGLLQLAQHPHDGTAHEETVLEELRRAAHSLKGDSRSVGIDTVAVLVHQVEEVLISLKHQPAALTSSLHDRLDQGLDAISLLTQEAVTGQPSDVDVSQLLDLLTQAVVELQAPQPAEMATDEVTSPNLGTVDIETAQPAVSFIEDEELRNLYDLSSQDRLQNLKAGLLELAQHPLDEASLEELRREAHSLKGDSRSVGVDIIAVLMQPIEEVLSRLQEGQATATSSLCDRLYQGLDTIELLVQEAVTGQPSGVDTDAVLNQLMSAIVAAPDESAVELAPEPSEPIQPIPAIASTFIEDAELREIYRVSSQDRLQRLEAGLLHLEKNPQDQGWLEQLLREAHSLKGDSRSVGLDTVEALIHQVEEILGGIKYGRIVLTSDLSDCLYQGLDAIKLLVQEAVTGRASCLDTAELLNRLIAAVSTADSQEPISNRSVTVSPPAQALIKAAQGTAATPETEESYLVDTIRVPTRDLDILMTHTEELTVTKIAIANITAQLEELETLWDDWKSVNKRSRQAKVALNTANPYQDRLEKLITSLRSVAQENSTKLDLIAGELRDRVRTLRLLPLSTVFQLFPRIVRDLAKQQSKAVELIVEGGEITADKRILEELKDSLMHILRNAIDHGVELPAEREQAGKFPTATIFIRAYQTGSTLVIEVADDGRGLDTEKIKQTAVKRGLFSREELAEMTESQIHALVFAPGFSTRTFITEISGRGIGLDVVRTNIERAKGTIQIESMFGQGCTFRIQISTALSTIDTMLLQVQAITHAVPLEFVQKTLLVAADQISIEGDQATITLEGQEIPVANLADLLELSNSPAYPSSANREMQTGDVRSCILLRVGEEQAGFFVDRLLDTQEVVIKPQSQLLRRVRNVAGATILPTGDVCTILNPLDLLKSLQKQTAPPTSLKPKKREQRKPVVLLVEDSIPVRTQEKRLLERAGYEVVIAVDGLDGYDKLQTRKFDAVVSDVEMPNLDGLSLTAKIRQQKEFSDLPIILVTTLSSDDDRKKGAEAGANAYVIKGKFNQDVLLEILGRLVNH